MGADSAVALARRGGVDAEELTWRDWGRRDRDKVQKVGHLPGGIIAEFRLVEKGCGGGSPWFHRDSYYNYILSLLYTRDDGYDGVPRTITCHVVSFHPSMWFVFMGAEFSFDNYKRRDQAAQWGEWGWRDLGVEDWSGGLGAEGLGAEMSPKPDPWGICGPWNLCKCTNLAGQAVFCRSAKAGPQRALLRYKGLILLLPCQ